MAVPFASGYKNVAHAAPNWDTQLRADMTLLEQTLAEIVYGPTLGGTGATLGNSAGFSGYASRKGQEVTYNGRFVFGSSASFGTGTPVIGGFNQLGTGIDTGLSGGYGTLFRNDGSVIGLMLTPVTDSTMVIRIASTGAYITSITPAQSESLRFHVDGIAEA